MRFSIRFLHIPLLMHIVLVVQLPVMLLLMPVNRSCFTQTCANSFRPFAARKSTQSFGLPAIRNESRHCSPVSVPIEHQAESLKARTSAVQPSVRESGTDQLICLRDRRLTGLAKRVGADYTRYADDLVFSGGRELARCSNRLQIFVAAIAHHEGFEIRRRKTRVMNQNSSQQIAGVLLNEHPNIPRVEYDRMRAVLHNCLKHGPETQNRSNHPRFRDHLLGRIAYWSTICPHRAQKLKTMFDRIRWA